MKKLYGSLLLILFAGVNGYGQDSTLVAHLQDQLYYLYIEDDALAGDAAKLLGAAIRGHQFILIGEQHGIVEVGQFTRALFKEAAANGFGYLAIETDPFIAQKLESLVDEDIDKLKNFNQELPYSIPFYLNEEDFAFLHTAKTKSKAKEQVFWGLDHVGGAAPRYLMTQLAANAPNEEARLLAESYLETGKTGILEFVQKMNFQAALMWQLTDEDYQKLYDAFGTDPASEAYQMISGIRKAKEIYSHWFEGRGYDNNYVRSQLMKENFTNYYRAAYERDGKEPQVVFKFGAYHMYRGLTPTRIYDIGNTVSEWANVNGKQSLHIYVQGIKGVANSFLGGNQAFDNTDDIDPSILAALGDRVTGSKLTLIDFRPLRKLRLKGLNPEFKNLMFAFDMMILVSEAKAVTVFE
ncbi:MAG: hypothetical protein AAF587_42385 [Bacteroidota bacterium]